MARWGSATAIKEIHTQGLEKKNKNIEEYLPLAMRRIFLATVRIGEEFDSRIIDPNWIAQTAAGILNLDEYIITEELDEFVVNPPYQPT